MINEDEDEQSDYNKLQHTRAALEERRQHVKLLESANKMKNTRVKDLRWKIDEKQKVIEAQQRDIDLLHTRDDKGMNREKVLAAQLLEGAVIISQAVQNDEKLKATIESLRAALLNNQRELRAERDLHAIARTDIADLKVLIEPRFKALQAANDKALSQRLDFEAKLEDKCATIAKLKRELKKAVERPSPANAFAALEDCWEIVDSIVVQFKKG